MGKQGRGISAAALLLVLVCCLALPLSQGHKSNPARDYFFAGQQSGAAKATTVPLRGFICDRRSAHEPCDLCPLGSYCKNETAMLPCPSTEFFCPLGSVAPIRVQEGYYTLPLATNHSRHYEEPCSEGFFCADGVKRVCPKGHYCPREMLTSPVPCGEEYLYCEEGSVRPKYAKEGWFTTGK